MHTVLVAMGLFALTFMSPGPNLLIVVQSSLSHGCAAGVAAGLGVAAGDAIYAALGLFGMAALISTGGLVFSAIKIAGGLYLAWYGLRLVRGRKRSGGNIPASAGTVAASRVSYGALFRRGLLTDLANPQTVLFFASIFSVTITPDTDWGIRLGIWLGLVLTSIVWRVLVSYAFSRPLVRQGYFRLQPVFERLVGVALTGFGLKLLYLGLARR